MQLSRTWTALAAAVVMAGLLSGSGVARATPLFVRLGDLPGGAYHSNASGVSDDGSVVVGSGRSSAAIHEAFRWTAAEGMVGLGDLPGSSFDSDAFGVAADGSFVVGAGISDRNPNDPNGFGKREPFRWSASEGMVALRGLGRYSEAYGVSADGSVVVGAGFLPSSDPNSLGDGFAFRWTESDGMVNLGALPGGVDSGASDVSVDGSVVVGSSDSATGWQAFRWTALEGMVAIGDTPGTDYWSVEGSAVSGDGSVVVGTKDDSVQDDFEEAFRWTALEGIVGLGRLPGDYRSAATDVSGDGSVIVGYSGVGADKGFLWTASDGMRNLRDIAVNDLGLDLSGWARLIPTGISADGSTIVGYGAGPNGTEAWMLVIPEPSSKLLLVAGVVPLLVFARRATRR